VTAGGFSNLASLTCTVKHFDRDPHTNQLLWFSGAPIDTPRAHTRQPRHSLDYLYFLARQRERQHRGEDVSESRRKAAVGPPISTELTNLYHEVFGDRAKEGERAMMDVNRGDDVEMSG
jgi:chromatin structure-remodeling complex subunit RSC1/2